MTTPPKSLKPGATNFEAVLSLHRRWLETEQREGQLADFKGADLHELSLTGCDLRHAILAQCDLRGVSFEDTNLKGADMRNANLRGAKFEGAILKAAQLFNADLENADLSKAKFLKGDQLGGCNLSYAKLPDGTTFHGIQQANRTVERLAVQFVALLASCGFSWLTIASTKHPELLTNASSVSLPFINISLPIVGFYTLVPIALPLLSMSFHIYLLDYWEQLATLPAYFPDGSTLTSRIYTTLLDRIVNTYMVRLGRRNSTVFYRLSVHFIRLGLFGMVPITLVGFWGRYMPRHDIVGTSVQIAALLSAMLYGWLRDCMMRSELQFVSVREVLLRSVRFPIVAIGISAALFLLSVQVLYGSRVRLDSLYANLNCQMLTAKSDYDASKKNSKGDKDKREGDNAQKGPVGGNVVGANLANKNLRYANLSGCVAESADFSYSNLEHASLDKAKLSHASLQEVNLSGAELNQAELDGANLQEAQLTDATVQKANLNDANFVQAELTRVDLWGATVTGANFSRASLLDRTNGDGIVGDSVVFALAQMDGIRLNRAQLKNADFFLVEMKDAHLWKANLEGASFMLADLSRANFTVANLKDVDFSQANLRETIFDHAVLDHAKLVCAQLYEADLTGANLSSANLRGAQLVGTILRDAKLTGADLHDALLEKADLMGADFRGVDLSATSGLTHAQLAEALLNEDTTFPHALEDEMDDILEESQTRLVP